MTTTLQLSCPECEKLVDMIMELVEDGKDLSEFFAHIINTRHYTFRGGVKCECGKFVIGCLSVTSNTRS